VDWRRGPESVNSPRGTGPVYKGLIHFSTIITLCNLCSDMRLVARLLAATRSSSRVDFVLQWPQAVSAEYVAFVTFGTMARISILELSKFKQHLGETGRRFCHRRVLSGNGPARGLSVRVDVWS
jgi:hypothetical protein